MSSGTPTKVAVLMGGPSAEREVSLSTGRGCADALRDAGYDVVEIDAGADLCARLVEAAPDVVFNDVVLKVDDPCFGIDFDLTQVASVRECRGIGLLLQRTDQSGLHAFGTKCVIKGCFSNIS